MATTKQTAVNYVTDRRLDLIRLLKDLTLIVDNLQQQRVFLNEEVEVINSKETRSDKAREILDRVVKKGEAACYKLLEILYITRQRTLLEPSSDSKDRWQHDLYHWISCFPFKEDQEVDTDILEGSIACHRYQTQLKCKARKITEGAWKQSCSLLPERCRTEGTFSYTPVVLDTDVHSSLSKIKVKSKRCKKARPKKLKSFIPMAKHETSPAELLKTHEKKILLFGKPGIGKTTVAHQMLNLWAEKDHRELDYMFYFNVRDISHRKPMSLEDLLFNMYSEPKDSKEEVLQDIKKNSENVVIIFDGITDLSSLSVVKDLVENLLPDAKIVTTCRPDQSEDFLTDWPTDWFRVEVKGFSEESIRAYLTQMLSAETDSLSSVLNNLELFSLCHVPMYVLMVVACIYFPTSEASEQTCTITEMYSNILRHGIQKHSGRRRKDIDSCLKENREKILSLAEIAFDATNEKNMNLTLRCEESSVHFAFLGAFMVNISPTASDTCAAFLHYTMQEFFGALWLLQNPDKIREVLEKCQTEEWKHTKHLIPFLFGLLNEKNIRLVNSLVPAQQIKKTSDWFFKEVVNTFLPSQTNQDHAEGGDPEFEIDLLFLCQCLYEYQSTEACQLFLDKLNYHLDLSGEHLDPHQCCAVSYVTSQSAERKVGLDLNGCTVSDQGVRLILGSLKNVRHLGPSSDDSSDPSMLCQLWTTLLSSEAEMDFTSLLSLCGNELHLPVQGERQVFERAEEVMTQSLERVNVCLHWDQRTVLSEALSKTILKCLPNINKLRFTPLQHQRGSPERLETEEKAVLLDLCLQAALDHRETFQRTVNTLLSLFSVYQTERYDILLDLYSHVKYNRNQTARSVLPSLQPLYQSAPAVWSIDLSERKTSLLLEVLKLQPGKKPVELKGWSDEESEVRSFLQCLSYISQLRFSPLKDNINRRKRDKTCLLNLCLQAALHERGTIQTTVEKVVSLSKVYHNQKCDFLLDLYSHVKDYETQTGRSVLPALQTVYQSAPAVWSIDLSKRKASLLLEVLKLQPEKKPVELNGWSDEESEVRSFLQCLSYISQLSFYTDWSDPSKQIKFLVDLLSQAAEWEEQTGEKTLKLVSSVWTYSTFPFCEWDHDVEEYQCDFLLDLYSHVKDYETQTGRSFLPALQPVYQSAPAVWSIDLSERKASLLLEVLKLQPEKKPVELKGWSDEESEVRSFLQCLSYISQLSFYPWRSDSSKQIKFLVDLLSQAAEWEEQTGEKTLKLVSSVWTYSTFPFCDDDDGDDNKEYQCDFLLDLYSHVKDSETQTGRSFLPALQPVYQSAPAVWSIDLRKRKASLLLEVLKLQPDKKPVELKDWSDEESEVRSFLQCLSYISQLSFYPWRSDSSKQIKFLVDLLSQAAEWEEQTGEKTLKLVSSVWTYSTFPFCDDDDDDDGDDNKEYQCDFLLDLYSHVKDSETQTGRSFLPALQPVYQSAPAVWSIDLSERKASLLLEVLKLQPEKKPVELKDWSDEESEVRSFLQCLSYISQLSCGDDRFFQTVCESIPVRSREEDQQLASLLQALGSTLSLGGVLPRKTCRSVGRVLGLCASRVDLTLTPSKISLQGAALLLRHKSKLHKLRLNVGVAVKLSRLVRRTGRGATPLTVPELSLVLKSSQPPERVLSRALSSVASLLRIWRVQCLDLTDFCIQGHSLITLLCHQGPLSLRLNSDTLQQLTVVVYEAQDKDLTQWFLEKVGGDLTSCRLDWEVLLSLLQHSTHNITVDLRKNRLLEKNSSHLLPFLGRVTLKRSSSSFVKSSIRQIYDSRASDCVSSLLRSSDHWINLNSRELDRVDCTALCFTLQHSHQVKVNLLWTSIPPGEIESILPLLDRVSQLSVDRRLLLSFLQCCAASQIQQGAPSSPPTAVWLLRSLHHRLDFSCSSSVDLSAQDQGEALCLTTDHCKAINSVLKQNQLGTQLVQNQVQIILRDCEVEDRALRELLPILHIVKLSPSKALLLQLLDLVCEGIEEGLLRHAESLCRALDGELDLSETRLDQKACGSLALVLEHSEGLSELDLSHCQLTDHQLQPLITHLHKVQVLDLSHNDITDALTDRILQLVSTNTSIHTVRLFNNRIQDRRPFLTDKRFEIW
ncbi:uncharacterized protein LOC112227921 isoform X3 [Oncorhynchus tshawytscha]|uniref:uncharacterized protein LOC112227921 isoform X3 n=1 Tax=Oncorhynchus tshawytscha TaxID=74940 RepID=UPI001C3D4087|nr:uncharacterized protein LOC112227921 isoform X3 [Oncorhynchus tshawytscha]